MECIDYESKFYPKRLKNIHNPPKKIYVEGNIDNLNKNSLSIVGSRNCTDYGERWCKTFTKELIKHNIVIVSGMAIGIDKIAHKTAINYGGKTIAVLPCGLSNIYPPQNKSLYKKILQTDGTIITEYSPNEEANSKKFLERNRIVSGLSLGLLVVEAAYRSGTSVTARLAFSQNRDVFCIPGSLDNGKSIGTNNLIKEFAKIVTSPDDILMKYGYINNESQEIKLNSEDNINEIPEEYRSIYKLITNNPININDIVRLSNIKLGEIMAKLTMLELNGKIKKISGNRYIRIYED